MEFVSPLKSLKSKQNDKFVLELRLGKLTIVEFSYDFSKKSFRLELFNLAIQSEKKK